MKRTALLSLAWSVLMSSNAQLPYTVKKYAVDTQLNIIYGKAVDYTGDTQTLTLDVYKPSGDTNCLRPLIILVHGGSWIGGSKNDAGIVFMAREYAARGWVAAAINYRLGTHKTSNFTMYALCNNSLSSPCAYICDSAEVYRAIFRGMQDARGAIRYMKGRHAGDSTDPDQTYIAGESAGAFIALAAGFTDKNSEKHASCYAIADAPVPDTDLSTYGCIPGPPDRSRADLGSIEGDLHTGGGFDARVKGAGSIYGGLLNPDILNQDADTPALYVYHQGADVVVNYGRGTLLGRINYECYGPTNVCQPYYFYPVSYGGESIRSFVQGNSGLLNRFYADILYNYSYQGNCFSNGHSVDNYALRLQNMIDLFAKRIHDEGNDPATNCFKSSLHEQQLANYAVRPVVFPNPAINQITVLHAGNAKASFILTDHTGKTVLTGCTIPFEFSLDLNTLNPGCYFLIIEGQKPATVLVSGN